MKIHLNEREAIKQILTTYEAKNSLRQSKINQRTDKHYYECANALAKLREEKNIDSILRTEKFYLIKGKEIATSKNEISSLKKIKTIRIAGGLLWPYKGLLPASA